MESDQFDLQGPGQGQARGKRERAESGKVCHRRRVWKDAEKISGHAGKEGPPVGWNTCAGQWDEGAGILATAGGVAEGGTDGLGLC